MSDIESRLKATIMDELAEWDDEFETPKWSAHTATAWRRPYGTRFS